MPRQKKPLAPRPLLEELLFRQEQLLAEQLEYLSSLSGKINYNQSKGNN